MPLLCVECGWNTKRFSAHITHHTSSRALSDQILSIHSPIHPSYTFITFYYPVVLLPAVHISPSRRFEAKCKDHISLVVIEKVPKITTHRPMWKWRYSKKPGCCPLINWDAPPIRYLVGGLEHFFLRSLMVGMMIQSDFHIFQRGRYTTNQITKVRW